MFRYFYVLITGIMIGGGMMYFGFTHHIVKTKDRVLLINKPDPTLQDVYVDIQNWTAKDWKEHPRVTRAMIAANYGEIVQESVTDDLMGELMDRFGVSSGRDSTLR